MLTMVLINTHTHVEFPCDTDLHYRGTYYTFNGDQWEYHGCFISAAWFIKNPSADIRNQPSVGKVK